IVSVSRNRRVGRSRRTVSRVTWSASPPGAGMVTTLRGTVGSMTQRAWGSPGTRLKVMAGLGIGVLLGGGLPGWRALQGGSGRRGGCRRNPLNGKPPTPAGQDVDSTWVRSAVRVGRD